MPANRWSRRLATSAKSELLRFVALVNEALTDIDFTGYGIETYLRKLRYSSDRRSHCTVRHTFHHPQCCILQDTPHRTLQRNKTPPHTLKTQKQTNCKYLTLSNPQSYSILHAVAHSDQSPSNKQNTCRASFTAQLYSVPT